MNFRVKASLSFFHKSNHQTAMENKLIVSNSPAAQSARQAETQTQNTQLARFRETLDGIMSYTLEKSMPDGARSYVSIQTDDGHEVTFIFTQEGDLLWITAESEEE
jgi:hypothetical protein